MARGGKEQREGNALKTALVVTGGLVLAWLTVETAFGNLLSRLRSAIDRSDPHADPDDEVVAPDPSTSASLEDEDEPEKPSPLTGGSQDRSTPADVDKAIETEETPEKASDDAIEE